MLLLPVYAQEAALPRGDDDAEASRSRGGEGGGDTHRRRQSFDCRYCDTLAAMDALRETLRQEHCLHLHGGSLFWRKLLTPAQVPQDKPLMWLARAILCLACLQIAVVTCTVTPLLPLPCTYTNLPQYGTVSRSRRPAAIPSTISAAGRTHRSMS